MIHRYASKKRYGLVPVLSFLSIRTLCHAAHYCFHWQLTHLVKAGISLRSLFNLSFCG